MRENFLQPILDRSFSGSVAAGDSFATFSPIQVKDKKILGYGMVVEGLNQEDSLKLQWHGLGGRQHFGCGWFYPVKEVSDAA